MGYPIFVKINAMLQRFENFISEQALFNRNHRLLLALSGGADSVCLFNLLLQGGYQFSIAHCNFNLRGDESNGDEQFVMALAKSKNIPFFTRSFDTKTIGSNEKKGIQEIARNIRYEWFFELMKEYAFDKLLTAHHLTDNVETMMINIMRGTGIKGLHGIPLNENNIARPLLFATRAEIENYLKSEGILYREDSSNSSDYYLRNKIRHFVLPELKKIQPDAELRFFDTAQKVKAYEEMALELIAKQWKGLSEKEGEIIRINIEKLNQIENKPSFLFYNIQQYGFALLQVAELLNSLQVGKRIYSPQYELIRERTCFLLQPIKGEQVAFEILIEEKDQNVHYGNQTVVFHILKEGIQPDFTLKNTLFLNADNLLFPLTLRIWQEGDKIKPLGMVGMKKISDILTDKKIDNSTRSSCLVLQQYNNELVALIPYVIHNDYRISPNTTKILSITLNLA